jgi:hypothetical protein
MVHGRVLCLFGWGWELGVVGVECPSDGGREAVGLVLVVCAFISFSYLDSRKISRSRIHELVALLTLVFVRLGVTITITTYMVMPDHAIYHVPHAYA